MKIDPKWRVKILFEGSVDSNNISFNATFKSSGFEGAGCYFLFTPIMRGAVGSHQGSGFESLELIIDENLAPVPELAVFPIKLIIKHHHVFPR